MNVTNGPTFEMNGGVRSSSWVCARIWRTLRLRPDEPFDFCAPLPQAHRFDIRSMQGHELVCRRGVRGAQIVHALVGEDLRHTEPELRKDVVQWVVLRLRGIRRHDTDPLAGRPAAGTRIFPEARQGDGMSDVGQIDLQDLAWPTVGSEELVEGGTTDVDTVRRGGLGNVTPRRWFQGSTSDGRTDIGRTRFDRLRTPDVLCKQAHRHDLAVGLDRRNHPGVVGVAPGSRDNEIAAAVEDGVVAPAPVRPKSDVLGVLYQSPSSGVIAIEESRHIEEGCRDAR